MYGRLPTPAYEYHRQYSVLPARMTEVIQSGGRLCSECNRLIQIFQARRGNIGNKSQSRPKIKFFKLATAYFPLSSIIGTTMFYDPVRNGKG